MGNWIKTPYPFVAACALASGGTATADACFAVYYNRGGLKICEKVGRASQGWTARKAYEYLRALIQEKNGMWERSAYPHVAFRVVRRHPYAPEPDKQVAVYYRDAEINICRKLGWVSEGWSEKRAYDTIMERIRMQQLAGYGESSEAAPEYDTDCVCCDAYGAHGAQSWQGMHGLLQLRQAKDAAWSFFCALSAGGMFGPELLEQIYGTETASGMARAVFPAMFGMAWTNFFFAASLTGLYLYGYDRDQRDAAKDLHNDQDAYAEHSPGLLRSFAGIIGGEAATLAGLTLMME